MSAPQAQSASALLARYSCTAMLFGALILDASTACAQNWTFGSAVSLRETATNNVDLQPSESRRSDLVTELTPSIRFGEKGARTTLNGTITVPLVFYARNGDKNAAYPSASMLGDVKLIDDLFHVEGSVVVAQQYFNPLGAQPSGFENRTQNRYRSSTYRVSPYIRSVTPEGTRYELRESSVWNELGSAPTGTGNSRYTQWTGNASNTEATLGWQANVQHTDFYFNNADPIRTDLARGIGVYTVDPQLRLNVRGGYEENHFALEDVHGPIYGAGFEWRPTQRTKVLGNWEHRYFGAAYQFSFDHRMTLSVWNLSLSRNITTFPQQLASLPAGGDLAALLNGLFLATIPDPVERQQTIDQFIRDRGLPSMLSSALNLYSQQIVLQESQTASVGLVGARNTVLLTVFNVRSEPIGASSSSPTPLLATGQNSRQTGVSLLWSHKLSPSLVLDASIQHFRTVANSS
ncbi:MAG: TIGR03016 family PEP-CTERM system-associated outer membrane protein, partial [Betaproteobacteria bacterium]